MGCTASTPVGAGVGARATATATATATAAVVVSEKKAEERAVDEVVVKAPVQAAPLHATAEAQTDVEIPKAVLTPTKETVEAKPLSNGSASASGSNTSSDGPGAGAVAPAPPPPPAQATPQPTDKKTTEEEEEEEEEEDLRGEAEDTFPSSPPLAPNSLTNTTDANAESPLPSPTSRALEDYYDVGKKLGAGHYASVFRAVNKQTKEVVAVKKVEKRLSRTERLVLEIDVMRRVGSHPNIVRLIDVFETETQVQLVLEYVEGGELFEYLVQHGPYTENDAARHIRDVTSAIAFLHERNIVHRDLKPENILLTSTDDKATIKIADFGLAKLMAADLTRTACGTWAYAAPEIKNARQGHDAKVDVWSIGVVTYVLLSAFHPFDPDGVLNDNQIWDRIVRGQYDFSDPAWDEVSEEAKSFVRAALTQDAKKRPSAAELLEHKWLRTRAPFAGGSSSANAANAAAPTSPTSGAPVSPASAARAEKAPLLGAIDQKLANFQDHVKTSANPFFAFLRSRSSAAAASKAAAKMGASGVVVAKSPVAAVAVAEESEVEAAEEPLAEAEAEAVEPPAAVGVGAAAAAAAAASTKATNTTKGMTTNPPRASTAQTSVAGDRPAAFDRTVSVPEDFVNEEKPVSLADVSDVEDDHTDHGGDNDNEQFDEEVKGAA